MRALPEPHRGRDFTLANALSEGTEELQRWPSPGQTLVDNITEMMHAQAALLSGIPAPPEKMMSSFNSTGHLAIGFVAHLD
jgi:hypothetical protein